MVQVSFGVEFDEAEGRDHLDDLSIISASP